MPLFRSALTWFRLTFRWSNSAQTWNERIGDLTLLAGILLATICTLIFGLEWWLLLVWGLCLLPTWGQHEAAAQEIQTCPPKHLALQHFQAVDMPLDRAGTPG